MAKKTVIQEVCDQCGKEGKTFEIVIHLPEEPAKVYDLCHIDYEALLAITGGLEFNPKPGRKKKSPFEPSAMTTDQEILQASTSATATRQRQNWDKEELQFLIDNPLMATEEAAIKLSRTFYAVRTRRHSMRAEGLSV